MPWTFATATDIGGREEQQDRVAVLARDGDIHLAVVADGMGGHEDGAAAAQAVIDVARQRFTETPALANPRHFLTELCREAHDAINGIACDADALGAGSTCVLLYVAGAEAYWAHVGDGRLYHFRNGHLLGRTQDHSMLELLRERRSRVDHEPGPALQHQIYMRLGGENRPEPDFDCLAVEPFDAFLLCSDGFWDLVDLAEMQAAVHAAGSTVAICEGLIELARSRAGEDADNISVVLARWLPQGSERAE